MSISSKEDLNLIQKLIERGLVEKNTLMNMLAAQKEAYEKQKSALSGTLFLLDLEIQEMQIMDLASDRELGHLDFSESDYRPGDWEAWGSDLALIEEREGQHQASWKPQFGEAYGLVLSQDGAYLYMPDGLKARWLGYTQTCLHGQVPKGLVQTAPYDLYLSGDQNLLGISNRGEGKIEVISTRNFEKRLSLALRKAGSPDTLNQAFDIKRQKLFVTDNQSTQLFEIDLKSGQVESHKPGLGVLGNLVMAPDGEHLYLLSLKPNQELLYLNSRNLSVEKRIRIKGDLYKNKSNAPCDLMSLSPDGNVLLVMSYLNSPEPFTPIISVLDPHAAKTLRRYAIKDGSRPIQLLFQRPNPLGAYAEKTLQEMILEAGLLDQDSLTAAMQDRPALALPGNQHPSDFQAPQEFIPPQPYYPPVNTVTPSAPTAQLKRAATGQLAQQAQPSPPRPVPAQAAAPQRAMGTQPLNPQTAPAPNAALTPAPVEEEQPQLIEVPPLDLPPKTRRFLQEILAQHFYQHHLLNLRDNSPVMERLLEEAERVRQVLETQDQAEVDLKKLLQGRSLHTVIRRRHLFLYQAEQRFLSEQEPVTLPLNCPMCHQNLMNQWECKVCGFELENPHRAFLHRVASADATTGLPAGHFLLSDPEGLRLLELNPRKEIVWHLDPDQLSCEYPIDCVRLPNGHLLVADTQRHQIYEVGSRGKIYWSLKIFNDDKLRLRDPVRVSWYRPLDAAEDELRYLIVDQGHHRVLEVDRESNLHREFGIQGEAGDDAQHLHLPSDVQFTPNGTWLICDAENSRVLEFDEHGQIEQEFNRAEYGLLRPTFARRLWNGDTLIVDSESFQILELNARGIVTERISYYKSGMPMEMRLVNPTQMIRLPNQDILLLNRHKIIQILPRQKKLIWFSALDKIRTQATEPVLPQTGPLPEEAAAPPAAPKIQKIQTAPIQTQTKPKPVLNTAPLLAQRPKRPPTGPLISGKERLQALMEKRHHPDNRESYEHSIVYTRQNLELLDYHPCLIDRRHNGVLSINRKGKVLWHFGYEMGQNLASPSFVQQTQHSLVIADTQHNRVLEISRSNKDIVREIYGPEHSPLARPRSAQKLENGNFLVADQQNKRLVELNPGGQIVWSYQNEALLVAPYYAEALPDNQVLFVDNLRKRVVQIDREGHVQWYYGRPLQEDHGAPQNRLFGPQFATRLPNGNTLIADTHHHRVLEVNLRGEIVWEYVGQVRSNRLNPIWADRLSNGNTLVAFNNYSLLVELNPEGASVWSYTLGKDIFLSPVEGDAESLVQHESEDLKPFYNPIEKRRIQTARDGEQDVVEVHIELMDNLQMKSVRAQLIMMEMERHGMVFKSFPAPEDLMADRFGKHLIIVCMLNRQETRENLQQSVLNIAEVVKVEIQDPHT